MFGFDLGCERVYLNRVIRSLIFLVLISCTLVARGDEPNLPPLPDPVLTAPLPTQQTPASARVSQEMVKLEFPNADVKDVLAFYGRLTNKQIVYDNTVSGPVNIVLSQPVPRDEAIKIIEMNLLLNGFSLVPAGPNITKVIGLSKNPRTAGVPIYSEESQIPETEQVITFLFRLKYADPIELQQTLAQYIAPSLYTSVVALPKSQALLVTESTAVIRGLLKVIAEIDVQPAEVVSEFIRLERADAKEVLEKLEKMFEKPANTPGVPIPPAPGAPAEPSVPEQITTTLSEDSVISGKIKLTADVRTNRIHVITRPINLPFIRKLIQEFDSDIQFGEPATRALKYISAGDVLDVVVKAISEPGAKSETGASDTSTPRTPAATTSAPARGGYGGGYEGGSNFSEELATETKDTTPTAVTVGNTKIIADRRANTIIVLGNAEAKQKVFKVLDEIDVRAPQVMLNTVIGELTLDDQETFGVDYLLRYTGNTSDSLTSGSGGLTAQAARRTGFAGVTRTGSPILDVASLINAEKLGAITGGGLTGFIGVTDSLQMIVRALQSTGNFRITNRPMVFTSNNKKAVIASGQEIAVPTQTLSSYSNGVNGDPAVSSSVSFKKVALQLEVVPLINSDREVSMDILQKLDSLVPGGDRNVGGSDVPTISTRYIKSSVNVANRATVALGGLITRNQNESKSGIPVLSKIPAIGALFRSKNKTRSRSELVVLIRPVVTMGPEDDFQNTLREKERLMIAPDIESTFDPAPQQTKVPAPAFRHQK